MRLLSAVQNFWQDFSYSQHLVDYTPLARLTNLSVLKLSACALPTGLWQQLARTNMPMRSVRHLNIDYCRGTLRALDADHLSSLVKCFPSLVDLSCVHSTSPNMEWRPLQQLLGLQSLRVSGISDAYSPVLASLQHLTKLDIMAPCSITALGLEKLTDLCQLAYLYIVGNFIDGRSVKEITNKALAGQV